MVQRIPCPNCKQAIYFSEAEGNESICISCSYRYILTLGTLEHLSVRVKETRPSRRLSSRERCCQTVHDIRVSTAAGYQALQFQLFDKQAVVEAVPNDQIALLFSSVQDQPLTLAWIKNLTTDVEYRLKTTVCEGRSRATNVGLFVLMSGLMLSLGVRGPAARLVQFTSFPLAIGAGYITHRRHRSRLLSQAGAPFLRVEQSRLQRLDDLEQRCQQSVSVHQATQALIQRLTHYQQKLLALDIEQYEPHLATVDRGLVVLNQRLSLSEQLVQKYRRAIALVEVEIETGRLAEQLPDAEAFSQQLWDELHELEVIEQQLIDLEHNEAVNSSYYSLPSIRDGGSMQNGLIA